jgi:hypothetical protein
MQGETRAQLSRSRRALTRVQVQTARELAVVRRELADARRHPVWFAVRQIWRARQ